MPACNSSVISMQIAFSIRGTNQSAHSQFCKLLYACDQDITLIASDRPYLARGRSNVYSCHRTTNSSPTKSTSRVGRPERSSQSRSVSTEGRS